MARASWTYNTISSVAVAAAAEAVVAAAAEEFEPGLAERCC